MITDDTIDDMIVIIIVIILIPVIVVKLENNTYILKFSLAIKYMKLKKQLRKYSVFFGVHCCWITKLKKIPSHPCLQN